MMPYCNGSYAGEMASAEQIGQGLVGAAAAFPPTLDPFSGEKNVGLVSGRSETGLPHAKETSLPPKQFGNYYDART